MGPDEWNLSDVLRCARRDAGISQRELARRAEVASSTVAAIESGTRSAPFMVVVRLLRAAGYGVQIHDREGNAYDGAAWRRLRDRAGRLFPAHLPLYRVLQIGDWWGDHCVPRRPRPKVTFDRRPPGWVDEAVERNQPLGEEDTDRLIDPWPT